MFSRRRRLHEALSALDHAATRVEWQQAAEALDVELGLDAWRAEDDSAHYDAELIRQQIRDMQQRRAARDPHGLFELVHESLYRHLNDLTEPELYSTAWGGTKHLVRRYLDEAEQSIEWLATEDFQGVPLQLKRELFARAARVYGRTALMLSGGATLGFHHLGVVKALFEADLLPGVITGASMGAMIAAGVCSRTDAELTELFADPGVLARRGLRLLPMRDALRSGHLLSPGALYRTILHNCGEWTFAEAHARSGRALDISVSPTRRRQKPRVLSHLTSPDVLVASAALASSMVPGIFPPVRLRQRGRDGRVRPYAPDERWIDGSMRGDLPMMRVGRLHNVNHFIVSQTNPHVLPFVGNGQQRGVVGWAAQLAFRAAHRQGVNLVSLVREVGHRSPLAPALDVAESLAAQRYLGDIDIFPPVQITDYRKMVANPTGEDLARFVAVGERGAWPKIPWIRDATRIERALVRCLDELEASPG
jgi:NTE family protein